MRNIYKILAENLQMRGTFGRDGHRYDDSVK